MRRWLAAPILFAAFAALTLDSDAPEALAQDKKHPDPVEEVFTTADGVRLKGLFHKAADPLDSKPVVILLYEPGIGNTMSKPGDWDGLTKTLLDGVKDKDGKQKGFNVFRFDWRGHGKSKDIKDPNEFWNNSFTGPWNRKYVKGATKKPLKSDIDVKTDLGTNLKNYLPVLANDLAAARAHLDRKNDSGDINASTVYVIGAGDSAGLGILWLAAEWSRPKVNPLVVGVQTIYFPYSNLTITSGNEAADDVAGAVWLSGTKPSAFSDKIVMDWVKTTSKLRDTNHMLMLHGEKDALGKKDATYFYKQVLVADGNKALGVKKLEQSYLFEIKGTALKGSALLGTNDKLGTEDAILKFLSGREKDRGAAVRIPDRKYTSPYYVDLGYFGFPRQ